MYIIFCILGSHKMKGFVHVIIVIFPNHRELDIDISLTTGKYHYNENSSGGTVEAQFKLKQHKIGYKTYKACLPGLYTKYTQ